MRVSGYEGSEGAESSKAEAGRGERVFCGWHGVGDVWSEVQTTDSDGSIDVCMWSGGEAVMIQVRDHSGRARTRGVKRSDLDDDALGTLPYLKFKCSCS